MPSRFNFPSDDEPIIYAVQPRTETTHEMTGYWNELEKRAVLHLEQFFECYGFLFEAYDVRIESKRFGATRIARTGFAT